MADLSVATRAYDRAGPMTPQQLRSAIHRLGISQVELSRRLGVNPRTVRRWVLGEQVVPGPVVAAVKCWLDRIAK